MYVYLHTYTCYHHASPKAKNKPLLHRQEKIALPWRSYRWICPTWVLLCARWASRRSCPRVVPVRTPRNRRRELWKKKGRQVLVCTYLYIYINTHVFQVPGLPSPPLPLSWPKPINLPSPLWNGWGMWEGVGVIQPPTNSNATGRIRGNKLISGKIRLEHICWNQVLRM